MKPEPISRELIQTARDRIARGAGWPATDNRAQEIFIYDLALSTFADQPKPQVRLGSYELEKIWLSKGNCFLKHALSAIQEAILSAQLPKPEPVDVEFDFEKWSKGGWQAYVTAGAPGSSTYPVDEIQPGRCYTMRRKT